MTWDLVRLKGLTYDDRKEPRYAIPGFVPRSRNRDWHVGVHRPIIRQFDGKSTAEPTLIALRARLQPSRRLMLVTILHYEIDLSEPYAPGERVLTPGEAKALNQLRAENIRNNGQRILARLNGKRKAYGATSELLSEQELADFRGLMARLDAEYTFDRPVGRPQSKPDRIKPDTLEGEMKLVAIERLDLQLKAQGLEVNGDQYSQLLDRFLTDPGTRELARERLAAKIAGRKAALEDLLGPSATRVEEPI